LGTLDKTPIILCADGQASAKYNVAPGVLDGNDVVRYMLYDGSSTDPKNGTTLSVNSDGKFVFDPSKMQLGNIQIKSRKDGILLIYSILKIIEDDSSNRRM
jgi:hypothetical protein